MILTLFDAVEDLQQKNILKDAKVATSLLAAHSALQKEKVNCLY